MTQRLILHAKPKGLAGHGEVEVVRDMEPSLAVVQIYHRLVTEERQPFEAQLVIGVTRQHQVEGTLPGASEDLKLLILKETHIVLHIYIYIISL